MHKFLFQITVFIYFISTVGFLVHIITLRKDAERIATVVLSVGFGFHTAAVLMRWFVGGHPPLVNLHDSLSFMAWAMIGSFLLFQWRCKLKSLGAFVIPFAMIIMTASSFQSKEILPLPPALKSIWLPIHAIICLFANAV
ncbi:MAG: c-type cytochrome biogenesis protein CcsB, partial [Thermodesulfobacteriota bacterium]|nr:c-type cytochrome biogenesis protein CcsB [Thermodesulfobacteriota bacterium]